jgi:hypothetical protein
MVLIADFPAIPQDIFWKIKKICTDSGIVKFDTEKLKVTNWFTTTDCSIIF